MRDQMQLNKLIPKLFFYLSVYLFFLCELGNFCNLVIYLSYL